MLLLLAFYLGLGVLAGTTHFVTLWVNVRLFTSSGSFAPALGLRMLRLSVLALVLVFVARHGALPLLVTTLGLLGARAAVVRRRGGVAT